MSTLSPLYVFFLLPSLPSSVITSPYYSKPYCTTPNAEAASTKAVRPPQIQLPTPTSPNQRRPNPIYTTPHDTLTAPTSPYTRGTTCVHAPAPVFLPPLLLVHTHLPHPAAPHHRRRHHSAYSISSLKFSQFNLTTSTGDATKISSKLSFKLSSKNHTKRITFYYNPIAANPYSSQVLIANGTSRSCTPWDATHITLKELKTS